MTSLAFPCWLLALVFCSWVGVIDPGEICGLVLPPPVVLVG